MGNEYLEYCRNEKEKQKEIQKYGVLKHEKVKELLLDFGYEIKLVDNYDGIGSDEKVFIAQKVKDIGMNVQFNTQNGKIMLKKDDSVSYIRTGDKFISLLVEGIEITIGYNGSKFDNMNDDIIDDISITIGSPFPFDKLREGSGSVVELQRQYMMSNCFISSRINRKPTNGIVNEFSINIGMDNVYNINQYADGKSKRTYRTSIKEVPQNETIILDTSSYEQYINEIYNCLNGYELINKNIVFQKVLKVVLPFFRQQFISVNEMLNNEAYFGALIEQLKNAKNAEINEHEENIQRMNAEINELKKKIQVTSQMFDSEIEKYSNIRRKKDNVPDSDISMKGSNYTL